MLFCFYKRLLSFFALIFLSIFVFGCSFSKAPIDEGSQDENYNLDGTEAGMEQQDAAQKNPFQVPFQMSSNMPLKMPNQASAPMSSADQGGLVNALSGEYKNVAKMFLAKNGAKQSDYFDSKASDVMQTGFVEFEIIPNDIMKNSNDPRLKSVFEKEAMVKSASAKGGDDFLNAKLIATYDCAVVDIIESIISSTPELTTCYDDLSVISLAIRPKEEPKPQEPAIEKKDEKTSSVMVALAALKPYTEQVNKVFSVVEFDKASSSVDISYYEQFKQVADTLKKFDGDYKLTIIGYQLYDETPFKMVKKGRGKKARMIKVKRKPELINKIKEVNNMLKTRALTVRKMMVTNGVDENKIVVAHPEPQKVKFLYNVKDGEKGENILENLIIVDLKFNQPKDFKPGGPKSSTINAQQDI